MKCVPSWISWGRIQAFGQSDCAEYLFWTWYLFNLHTRIFTWQCQLEDSKSLLNSLASTDTVVSVYEIAVLNCTHNGALGEWHTWSICPHNALFTVVGIYETPLCIILQWEHHPLLPLVKILGLAASIEFIWLLEKWSLDINKNDENSNKLQKTDWWVDRLDSPPTAWFVLLCSLLSSSFSFFCCRFLFS